MKFNKLQKIFFGFLFGFLIFVILFLVPQDALAQVQNQEMMNNLAEEVGLPIESLPMIIIRVVKWVLTFLGLIAVIIVIYGGFTWMTSGGIPEKIAKAKKILIAGLIGLAIIIFAYAIVSFVMNLLGQVAGPGGPGQICTPGQCLDCRWICKPDGTGGQSTSGCDDLCSGLPECPCPPGDSPYITGSLPDCYLSPSSGSPGTYVTIRGCRFGGYNSESSKVYFGTTEAQIVLCQGQPSWSETKIVVEVPELKAGEYDVKVVNAEGESNPKPFKITSEILGPSIACVVPDYGKEGDPVKVEGKGFGRQDEGGKLTFNNVEASPTSWEDNLIVTPVPENAFSGDVVVTIANQQSNGYPFRVVCENNKDCASQCCINRECRSPELCRCAQSEESCENISCCSGLSCCPDKKCRKDCSIDGGCVNGECPPGYTCCPGNLCKINCGGNNPGQSCKLDKTCGDDYLCSPYQCVSSGNIPPTECRCCCRDNSGCSSELECDRNEICYQSAPNTPAVYGLCCGCTQNSQCGTDNLCRTSPLPRCCVGCQNQKNGTKCYVPGLPNNEGECCNGKCCHGYCINGQCLTTCGNNNLEEDEECDATAQPTFHPDKDTCEEVDPKYVGGELGCNPNCTFDVSGCYEAGQAGGIGELCKKEGVNCPSGAPSCQNPQIYSCLENDSKSDCRCCCNPLDNKCPNNLRCTADKAPCNGMTRGLCCGCRDDSQCGENNVCGDDSCCYYLPPPTEITFKSNPSQIEINWTYPTNYNGYNPYKYVTTFEIERAEKPENKNCDELDDYLKIAEDKNCQPDTNVVNCSYIDKGNFSGKTFCYRIRARHGTQTAYSDWNYKNVTVESGQVGCQENKDCPKSAPCCHLDLNQCVTWEFCGGNCEQGGDCQPPAVKYAEADFSVTTGPIGACLVSVLNNKTGDPNFGKPRGYWLDEIKATGYRFGRLGELVFEDNKSAPISRWSDEQILAKVPAEAKFDSNQVVVKKQGLLSNPVSFRVLKQETGPGQTCYEEGVCPLDIGVCWNPPAGQVFSCLAEGNCYCCCQPGQTPDPCKTIINERLECRANQSPCTGNNRGLCCGCQKDADCGEVMGCGMIEPEPKCCYQRPSWENTSFCQPSGSPSGEALNTSITLTFSEKMDFGSINNNNLKISRVGSCLSTDEGQTINGRCYLFGTISNYNEEDKTKTVFSPRICQLQPGTEYLIEIVVGQDGQGVRSEKGVSINASNQNCTWDTKKCQSQIFTTAGENVLCEIEWIDVQPREQIVRDLNISVNYYGYARDRHNNPICVSGFTWSSSDPNVAWVNVHPEDSRIGVATSKGLGEAGVIASIPSIGKTCYTLPNHTCGILKVSLGGPRVIEQENCQVCNLGGQSPSPWKFSTDACLNAQIVARFDREMNQRTLNSNNIKVRQCTTGDFNNPGCENGEDISGEISPTENKFYFKPSSSLDSGKIYRVTLKSGEKGIKDKNGLQLDGNRNSLQDGSPADDYVWYFKTGDTVCSLDKVCVSPQEATLPRNSSQQFTAEIYTSNCNYLETNSLSWSWLWESLNPNIATVSPTNQWQTNATGRNLGETDIKVTEGNSGKSDQAHLIVTTIPTVEEKEPTGENVCRNILISATFDQEMDHNTLNSQTVRLYKKISSTGIPIKGISIKSSTKQFLEFFKNIFIKIAQALTLVERGEIEKGEMIELVPGRGKIILPPTDWELIPGVVSSYNKEINGQIKTVVVFKPNSVLDPEKDYRVNISGSVKSKYGVEMGSTYSWQFTTGEEICYLSKVTVKPSSWLAKQKGESKDFSAHAYDNKGNEIYGVPGYNWTWQWEKRDDKGVIESINPTNSDKTQVTIDNKNGLATLIATATISEGGSGSVSGSAQITAFLCENPWPEIPPYNEETTNFEFYYCRDNNPLLPELVGPTSGPTGGNLIKNLLFSIPEKNDVIGVQVYENPDHLTPAEWYWQNVPNPGSTSELIIDGYQAVQSGRTIYVGATNVDLSGPEIDTNIYLISHNDGASPETINIFNQLVKNWRFNTNKSNGTYLISDIEKGQIQRDLVRLYALNQMSPIFENYKNQHGYYPKLEAGTYIVGMSTSRWPSWQQTLAQELGQPLPIDPINKFESPCADCPGNNSDCDGTCYNPAPNQKKYECLNGSNVYQYKVLENGEKYNLYLNLEYSNPSDWQHYCGDYNSENTCLSHHWCEWQGEGCQSKNLDYSANPCDSPSSCQCFNTAYRPTITSITSGTPLE